MLSRALEFGTASAVAMQPWLAVAKTLERAQFATRVIPTVIKLFASPDRAVRVALLNHMELFIEHLSPSQMDEQVRPLAPRYSAPSATGGGGETRGLFFTAPRAAGLRPHSSYIDVPLSCSHPLGLSPGARVQVFPHLVTGYTDAAAFVRELTLKCTLVVAPKLQQKTINQQLLKHLSKLQIDEEQVRASSRSWCFRVVTLPPGGAKPRCWWVTVRAQDGSTPRAVARAGGAPLRRGAGGSRLGKDVSDAACGGGLVRRRSARTPPSAWATWRGTWATPAASACCSTPSRARSRTPSRPRAPPA